LTLGDQPAIERTGKSMPIEVLADGQTKRVAGVAVGANPMYNLQ